MMSMAGIVIVFFIHDAPCIIMVLALSSESINDPMPASPEYRIMENSRFGNADNGINGFLLDVQTRVWKKIQQSGFELFIKTFSNEYIKFLIVFDPYFYAIVDDWDKNSKNVKRKVMEKCKDNYGNNLIKETTTVKKHIYGLWCDIFFNLQPAIKVTTFYPNDVPMCRNIVGKIDGVIEWREADIPFPIRGMIDLKLNVGKAYNFKIQDSFVYEYKEIVMDELPLFSDKCTFDTEIRKPPIKKPKPGYPFTLLGYKYAGNGIMLNNMEILKVPIADFWIGAKDGKVCNLTVDEVKTLRHKYAPIHFIPDNVTSEQDILEKWKIFLKEKRPKVVSGYNSDAFDWNQMIENGKMLQTPVPFDDLFKYDDYEKAPKKDGYLMIDAIDYIQRDSYLPKGYRGLKDVARILLGVEPLEIDHEETVVLIDDIQKWADPENPEYDVERATEEVQKLAYYCASDVFTTSILIDEYVTNLDLSLATIIPMTVFETARKARGPMVEALLLKRMHDLNMIAPNKVNFHGKKTFNPRAEQENGFEVSQAITVKKEEKFAKCINMSWIKENCKACKNHSTCKEFLDNPIVKNKHVFCEKVNDHVISTPNADLPVDKYKFEGAYVDIFQVGLFKDNCKSKFEIDAIALNTIEKKMKSSLLREIFSIKENGGKDFNTKELLDEMHAGFEKIRSQCTPGSNGKLMYNGLILIIHVDVSSMYPSLILTYNLQPHAVVNETICNACPYHYKENEACCWIELPWNAMYDVILMPRDLKKRVDEMITNDMKPEEVIKFYKEKLSEAIKNKETPKQQRKNATFKCPKISRICQKAHKDAFIGMVDDFRKERFKYKAGEKVMNKKADEIRKTWKNKEMSNDAKKELDKTEIKAIYNRNVQLAYKVILNAIYGWLWSAGARLLSIDVTGCTTMAGQKVIKWTIKSIDGFTLAIELDTDGSFNAIPVDFPLEVVMKYKDKNGNDVKSKFNLFSSVLNHDVKEEFTNYNNYEWDETNQAFVNIPKCEISFSYDEPCSTFFVQCEKKYTAKARDENDETKQKVVEIKGMDQKRKGELPIIKEMEIAIDDAYTNATSYDNAYGKAVEIVNDYIERIKTKRVPPQMIYESRDVSSVEKVQHASSVIKELEIKGKYDPSKIPINATSVERSTLPKDIKNKIINSIGGDNKSLNNKQSMGCMRLVDLGIEVADGETVQWIVTKYPVFIEGKKKIKGSITQRVVPTLLFKSSNDELRKYLKRWVGFDVPETFDRDELIASIIDWDYYLSRLATKVFNIVINPYMHQQQWIDDKSKMEKLMETLGFKKNDVENKDKTNLFSIVDNISKIRTKSVPSKTIQSFVPKINEVVKKEAKKGHFKIDDFL
jgi:DNA polymerase elongation subunit (family B)